MTAKNITNEVLVHWASYQISQEILSAMKQDQEIYFFGEWGENENLCGIMTMKLVEADL